MAEPATTRFHYPPVAEYTGLVQFCIDRHDTAEIRSGDRVYGKVRRGEVVRMKEGLAKKLVTRGGNYSHVAADTPLGPPPSDPPQQVVADDGVPVLITAEMFARLVDAGFTEEQINGMTPQQAHDHLSAKE